MGIDIISVFKPPRKTISMQECHELRTCIQKFTNGCLLTKKEYLEIMLVLSKATDRLEKSRTSSTRKLPFKGAWGMGFLINYFRAWFCKHEWELVHNSFVDGDEFNKAYFCKVYRCKKCGYSKKYTDLE